MNELKEKLINFYEETKYEIYIFIYLYIRMMLMLPTEIMEWCSTYYGVNYSYGFIPRGLVGSIFSLVFNGDICFINAHSFILTFQIILIFLTSILFGKIIRLIQDKEKRKMFLFFVAIYLVMPFSIIYLFDKENYGRLDLYLYIITIIQFLLIFKKTNLIRLIFVGVLSVICIMIHEAYVLYMFPILLAVLIYKLYKNKFDNKTLSGIIIIIFLTFIATVHFNIYNPINIETSNELFDMINSKTDLKIYPKTLKYEYYNHNILEHMSMFGIEGLPRNSLGIILCLILLSPVNVIIYKSLKIIYSKRQNKLYEQMCLMLKSLILPYFAVCIIACDWGRWFAAFYTLQIIIVLLLYSENEEKLLKYYYEIKEKYRDYKISIIYYLMFLSSFGPFQHIGIFSAITHIICAII